VQKGFTSEQQEKLATLRLMIAMIPANAKVAASERLLPHMADRPDAYRLQHSVYDAEYVLVDRSSLGGDERKHFTNALKSGKYGVTKIKGDFVLAKLGAPTKRNDKWQHKR
jgi:hypothetical protein